MMTPETWIAFAAVWLLAAAIPGPNAAYAVAVGSRHGMRAGVFAAAGFAFAVAVYVTLVALGLLAFLAASATLFTALKWIGVAYLVWLGLSLWRAPVATAGSAPPVGVPGKRTFVRAAAISLTNPKSALAYVMIYPQFMDAGPAAASQLTLLGATSVAISFAVYSLYGVAAGGAGRWVRSRRAALVRNRVLGSLFVGAGAALALAERR